LLIAHSCWLIIWLFCSFIYSFIHSFMFVYLFIYLFPHLFIIICFDIHIIFISCSSCMIK